MTQEPAPALGRPARLGLIALGAASLLAAVPVGFFALVFGGVRISGWHGTTPEPEDWAVALTLLGLPVLLLALGAAALACVNRRRLRIVAIAAAALVIDLGLSLASLDWAHDASPDFRSRDDASARAGL